MTGDDRLVFIDVETTGLIPSEGLILEVGVIITDLNLIQKDVFQQAIWDSPSYDKHVTQATLDEFVWNMHTSSGLIAEATSEGLPMEAVEDELGEWLEGYGIGKDEPMVGSSVQFDRMWLEMHMPSVFELFSYRNIDISSIKELCRRYNPPVYARLDEVTHPKKAHRVIPDLEDSINELVFYRDNFIFDVVSEVSSG